MDINLYIEQLGKLGLLNHIGIQKSLLAISINPKLNENFFKCISQVVIANQILDDPFQPYASAEDMTGKIKLGNVLPTNFPFGLEIEQLMRNILILGVHGTGKTNAIIGIIKNLYHLGIPFLIIDVAKKDSRHLIRELPDLHVITAKNLKLNPIEQIEGVSPMASLNDFVDVYCHQIEVMLRSKSYVVKAVKELFDIFGVYNGDKEYPNLEDMELLLSEKLKVPGNIRDDFLRKIYQRGEMLMNVTGDMFKCSKGFALEKILDNPVVLELDELSEEAKTTVVLFLLTRILRYRISRRERGRLLHVVIFDEGKRVFDHTLEKNFYMGIPPLDFLVSYARDFGEGLIVGDQESTKLTNTIKACSNTKFLFMVSGGDIWETARISNLNDKQRDVLQQLPAGTAIVKMDERFNKPFLVKFDYHPIERTVTDEEVEEHSRKFIEDLNRDVNPRSSILLERMKREEKTRVISRDEETLLIHAAQKPELTVSERFKSIGFTNYVGDKALKGLSLKGFITKVKIYTGKRGAQPVIIDITDKGRDYLKSKEIRIRSKGKGGVVHQYWQSKIKEFYKKQGQTAVIEPNARGANTDVLTITQDGKRIAIEVALSKYGQMKNLQRDLKYFDKVLIASQTKNLMGQIQKESKNLLNAEDLKRVRFCLLQDFLP